MSASAIDVANILCRDRVESRARLRWKKGQALDAPSQTRVLQVAEHPLSFELPPTPTPLHHEHACTLTVPSLPPTPAHTPCLSYRVL